jgi:uncharacterized pyridoxamine 5'-phosphate oxidase family protein
MSDMADDAVSYIENSSCALLITVGEENKPFVRYIGPFVNNGLDIFFMTLITSQKVKHIDNNPFVTLYFQNPVQTKEEFKSIAITGKAARVPEGNEFNGVLEKMGRKSPGFKNYISSEGFTSWTIYKITATTLQCTDFSKSTKTVKEEL